mmetsp:Transcript_21083/g.56251  ORF Transcript_21083/g.56251 Transcript_21083/m.56251 type:complete len:223 (-) Transcript_21083:651-1319(-)
MVSRKVLSYRLLAGHHLRSSWLRCPVKEIETERIRDAAQVRYNFPGHLLQTARKTNKQKKGKDPTKQSPSIVKPHQQSIRAGPSNEVHVRRQTRMNRGHPRLGSTRHAGRLARRFVVAIQKVPPALREKIGVVRRSHQADRARGARKCKAQAVGQGLELVGGELVIVEQDLVVSGAGGALEASLADEEEVELLRVADGGVHHGAGRDIAGPVRVFGVRRKYL